MLCVIIHSYYVVSIWGGTIGTKLDVVHSFSAHILFQESVNTISPFDTGVKQQKVITSSMYFINNIVKDKLFSLIQKSKRSEN